MGSDANPIADPTKYKGKYRNDSLRMKGWDYRSPAIYFVTICTKGRYPWFGENIDGRMTLSNAGRIVNDEWNKTAIIRPYISLDEYVIMPDHVHMIVIFKERSDIDHNKKSGTSSVGSSVVGSVGSGSVGTPCHGVPTDHVEHTDHGVPTDQNNQIQRKYMHKPQWNSGCLGAVIGQFKIACTKRIRKEFDVDFHWQPRYYESRIRCQKELYSVRTYIKNNPVNWKNRDAMT